MTQKLPYTRASITRRILTAREAGLFVASILPDGTLLISDTPPEPDRKALDEATAALAMERPA